MLIGTSVWCYWLVCGCATSLLWMNWQHIPSLLGPAFGQCHSRQDYIQTVLVGWVTTLLTAIVYILFTHKQASGGYRFFDLLTFSFLNGVLEQLMFAFCFLVGCWLGCCFDLRPWQIFGTGFFCFCIYAGLIHGLFWVTVLPSHYIVDAIGIPFAVLLLMSFVWMQLLWRHRAITAIITMHIFLDFLTIGHLHFSWFEAYQLI
jgi:chlorophyllide a hydrolase